ncbi:HTH-type transcriptional regulator LutR [Anaerolineae bacterium]|nr:HTH-type transcriptional regulator LutR [Anaerolineae bacterium]
MQETETKNLSPYQPIKQGIRLYQAIAEHIEELIINGRLNPGDRLPSESELAEQLRVSRTAVREAIKTLNEKGLVQVEVGRGTFVLGPSSDKVTGHLTLLLQIGKVTQEDLIAARKLLEVEIAGLAAENRTQEDLNCMGELIQQMELHLSHPDESKVAGAGFHEALARATGNSVYPILIQPLLAMLTSLRKSSRDPEHDLRHGLGFHREILSCIEQRDKEGAREVMRVHLDDQYEIGAHDDETSSPIITDENK